MVTNSNSGSNLPLQQKVVDYYTTKESRWGYFLLLKGVKHFGYYPEGREDISMADAQRLMVEKLRENRDLPADSLLLDAGCGEGEVATYLANRYQFRVQGVDLQEDGITKAEKRRARLKLERRVEFRVMDYMDLAFPDETFDGVYTMETLVHAPDYRQALREFHRVLKPGGTLVLFEYSMCPMESYPRRLREIARMVIEESAMYSLPLFLHDRFSELLENSGYTVISTENATERIVPMLRTFYRLAWLPYQLIKLLGRQRQFINTTFAAESYENRAHDYARYNIVVARKDGQRK